MTAACPGQNFLPIISNNILTDAIQILPQQFLNSFFLLKTGNFELDDDDDNNNDDNDDNNDYVDDNDDDCNVDDDIDRRRNWRQLLTTATAFGLTQRLRVENFFNRYPSPFYSYYLSLSLSLVKTHVHVHTHTRTHAHPFYFKFSFGSVSVFYFLKPLSSFILGVFFRTSITFFTFCLLCAKLFLSLQKQSGIILFLLINSNCSFLPLIYPSDLLNFASDL